MIIGGEFLHQLDDFSLGWKNVTARLAIGLVCVAGEYIVDYSLIIIIFYKNNKIIKID